MTSEAQVDGGARGQDVHARFEFVQKRIRVPIARRVGPDRESTVKELPWIASIRPAAMSSGTRGLRWRGP